MYFRYVQFFQKTNEKIQPNYYGTSCRIVFVRFLEELKTSKRHFEINWPLVVLPNDDEDVFNVILSSSMVVFLVAICAGEIATGAFVEWKWSHLDVVAVEEWLIEPLVPVEAMEKVCNVAPFSEEELLLSLSFCYPDDKIESKKINCYDWLHHTSTGQTWVWCESAFGDKTIDVHRFREMAAFNNMIAIENQ